MNSGSTDKKIKLSSGTFALPVVVFIIFAIASIIASTKISQHSGYVSNDSTQFLAGARAILENSHYTTSILFFDEHYQQGSIPAKQTVWPPGLSMTIAALASLGLTVEESARLLTSISYVLLVTATILTAWYLTSSISATIGTGAWLLMTTTLWGQLGGMASELPFMAVMMGMVLIYVHSREPETGWDDLSGPSFRILSIICLLAGIAFLIRYAGAFLIAWSLILVGIEAARRIFGRTENPGIVIAKAAAAAVPAVLIVVAIAARNFAVTGTMRGANNELVVTPVDDLILSSAKHLVSMLTGVNKSVFFDSSTILAVVGSLAILLFVALTLFSLAGLWRIYSARKYAARRDARYFSLAILIAIYIAGIIVVSSRTAASLNYRYLLPMVPLIIVYVTCVWPLKRNIVLAIVTFFCATQAIGGVDNSYNIRSNPLAKYDQLTHWIKSNTAESEPILVIGDGQVIGHYSERPTLAVPSQRYTAMNWSEAEMRDIALNYGVRILIFTRFADVNQYGHEFGAFASSLSEGSNPEWLNVVAELEQAVVYEIVIDD